MMPRRERERERKDADLHRARDLEARALVVIAVVGISILTPMVALFMIVKLGEKRSSSLMPRRNREDDDLHRSRDLEARALVESLYGNNSGCTFQDH